MTQLFAQPYDISATGFYFEDYEEYQAKAAKAVNDYGDPVEEFEIQFIDGEDIDCDLAKAWGLSQANAEAFLEAADNWNERQKIHYIIAVGECGYNHEEVADDPEDIDIIIYRLRSMRELAEEMVEEGIFGEIPAHLENYIDYERIARDLEMEYSSTTIAGEFLLYQCM
ncbi:MAG: antirestriction protein ArdA [Cohaesibacter sp.]|nr:antirestriction protein ArdA [Cohaesibacter sp.]